MKNLTNEKLYERCKYFGKLTLNYRNKFIGLLPEVHRRRLYEQKGFSSIFEFAKKLAGLSEEQVRIALNLEKKFSDKPILHDLFTTGKVSMNKLARIISVATVENEEFLANQVQLLSKSAVETFVRDIKHVQKFESQDGLFKPETEAKSLPGQDARYAKGGKCAFPKLQKLKLSPEVIAKLSELQNKGLDINEMILNFLKQREQKIEKEKAEIAKQTSATENFAISNKKTSRYIPSKTKRLLREIHGTKCAVPHCQKPAKEIHHTARFALSNSHNPHFLAPLCNEHHTIAHSIDQRFLTAKKDSDKLKTTKSQTSGLPRPRPSYAFFTAIFTFLPSISKLFSLLLSRPPLCSSSSARVSFLI